MKKIVITGNIGSGKSKVTEILKDLGYKTASADEISAKILEENHKNITKMFSMPPQKFETFKKRLSDLVFMPKEYAQRDYKQELEDFMLPKINKEIEKLYKENPEIIIEMPTFFENRGLKKELQDEYFIIMVIADKDIRFKRIKKRNSNLSLDDIIQMMRSQIDPYEKKEYCDIIIWNNTDEDELVRKVNDLSLTIRDIFENDKQIKCQNCGSTNFAWCHNDDYCQDVW